MVICFAGKSLTAQSAAYVWWAISNNGISWKRFVFNDQLQIYLFNSDLFRNVEFTVTGIGVDSFSFSFVPHVCVCISSYVYYACCRDMRCLRKRTIG